MQVIQRLIHSRKFWISLFGVVQTVIFQFVPDFPDSVWVSIDALVMVLITTISIEDASENISGSKKIDLDETIKGIKVAIKDI